MSEASLPGLEIAPARAQDIPGLIEVIWEAASEGWLGTEVPFDRAEMAARFSERVVDDDHLVLVAHAGGRVVGELTLSPLYEGGLYELGMCVSGAFRSRGVGRALLERAIEWARDRGAYKITLQVWPENTGARALYEKLGFEQEGLLRDHWKRADGSLKSAVVMGLLLQGG